MDNMLVFFVYFLLFSSVYANYDCPLDSICGNNPFDIRFPFGLQGPQNLQHCTYPGFNLKCNNQGRGILNLPGAGDFYVRDINYLTQEIQLYDPSNCLPKRLIDFQMPSLSVFNVKSTVSIPVSWTPENDANVTTGEIQCFDASGSDRIKIFRIIALALVIPAILCSMCVAFYICYDQRREIRQSLFDLPTTNAGGAAIVPHEAETTTGLDDSTIESYTKVVLGESRRVPGKNHLTCSICLADYHPKETVRCIPECEHCFHAECLDEWLKINGTCPVCRNNPSPVHVNFV
ncbi:hypothetical protein KY285_002282 [Solanum tuberosum]|nr:hypothetical protein KY285_002282 [Solanum tuberosum]